MVVSFSVGSVEKNKKIINTLKKQADNVNFYSYSTIQELIKEASARHLEFKRIIFSTAILNDVEKDLNELNDFIKNYSTSTEVVMILSKPGEDVIFNSIFNSPMYTPVILPKATARNVLDLVKNDIMNLKTMYYTFDKNEKKEISTEIKEEVPEESDTSETVSDVGESTSPVSNGFASGPASVSLDKDIFNSIDVNIVKESYEENLSSFQDGPSPIGEETFNSQNFEDEDEISLSIGSFGSSHSDTGYLDEDDEELQAFLSQQKDLNIDSTPLETRNPLVTEESKPIEIRKPNLEPRKPQKRKLPNIDLVLSTRDNRATQSIVDQSVEIYNRDSVKVLIIDLDTKCNSILSYIDTDRFYRESAFEGITKQRIYTEDGVSVVSNGYGVSLSVRDLMSFLDSQVFSEYDMVFIDCPTDCMNVLSVELLQMVHPIIFTKGDRSSLIYTSLALTNRKKVSLEVERWIMNNCLVDIEGGYLQEDIDFINNTMLFANGSWLQRKDI